MAYTSSAHELQTRLEFLALFLVLAAASQHTNTTRLYFFALFLILTADFTFRWLWNKGCKVFKTREQFWYKLLPYLFELLPCLLVNTTFKISPMSESQYPQGNHVKNCSWPGDLIR